MILKHTNNVHEYRFDGKEAQIAFISDLHWDNPKTDRKLLKKHLDYCLENKIPVHINGDMFCLMQGKGDKRGSKSDILPEHNNSRYLDSIVETAVEWFAPYKDILTVIGYGNHECYHSDTEVLTERGWVNIKEVTTSDSVYVINDTHIYTEKPNATLSKQVDEMVKITGSYSCQYVSGLHQVLMNDMSKVSANQIESGFDKDLPHGRITERVEGSYNANLVELLTAVVMDATLVDDRKYKPNSNKRRIQFKISKPEKIEYLKKMLERSEISYTIKEATKSGLNKLQPYLIRIYGDYARFIFDLLEGVKRLPYAFKHLQGKEFNALLQALENTDGFRNGNSLAWNTTSKHDVDIIQTACIFNGWNFSYKERENGSGFANGKLQYRCRISDKIVKNKALKIEREERSETVYCLNMPSGNFITRYKGKVAFSGNTAIIKYQETDILQRFVDLFNLTHGAQVFTGGYGGWISIKLNNKTSRSSFKGKYFHGSGGGGIVTKGAINLTRALEMIEGMDFFTMGHIHENASRNDVREVLVK